MEDQSQDQSGVVEAGDPEPVITTKQSMPLSDQQPTVGRQVHYVARANSHQGLRGGQHYPATVIEVHSATCLTLSVLSTSAEFPVHVITSVANDEDGVEGTWHWPERS